MTTRADTKRRGRPKRDASVEVEFDAAFWARVEQLRQYMNLTCEDLASLFAVTRLTYYNWTHGRSNVNATSAPLVKDVVRRLAKLVSGKRWPTPDAMALTPKQRRERLLALLAA